MTMISAGHLDTEASRSADVLIIGSGICGTTYLRVIADALPETKIVMVEAGPRLTNVPGTNVKNIAEHSVREEAQVKSQGPTQFPYEASADLSPERANEVRRLIELARPGTFLLQTEGAVDFPAGAASSNVGGMGAHWTCACPTPDGSERIPFIEEEEMDRLLAKARTLLAVHNDLFDPSPANRDVLERIQHSVASGKRPVAPMPMACRIVEPEHRRVWTGPDTILGDWASRLSDSGSNQRLMSETLAVRLVSERDRVTGVVLRDRATGEERTWNAKVVVVAADSFRTPQLLWNSKIRPEALGCYLNEHPQVLAAVSYAAPASPNPDTTDIGVFWVPFDDAAHPFHGQVLPLSVSPIPIAHGTKTLNSGMTIALSWFCRKQIRREDRVLFSDTEEDYLGMPAMQVQYGYSEEDRRTIAAATAVVQSVAEGLGCLLEGEAPRLLQAGRSLHYQGTVRMGESDDGSSVCDPFGRVWTFTNLFVAGNGVLPASTACNPTLTSVAMAIRGAESIIEYLSELPIAAEGAV